MKACVIQGGSIAAARSIALSAIVFLISQLQAAFDLPVEVLGTEGTTESRTFTLTADQVNDADKIFFFVNNLGYENKGSIQVNSGSWISLNHTDIDIFDKEMTYGGMQHGGMNSIRFTIPSSGLVAGSNTVNFRFDISDGISIGYRVIRFDLLDASGSGILPESFFSHEDPNTWTAPAGYASAADVTAGEDLWYNGSLTSHYLDGGRVATWYGNNLLPQQPIKASCMDCHTQDGRDLEYFSYSNRSIIERSKFHGLTEAQGSQVAAYIRSLNVPRHGRPWNPPYQPGPSVGEKPVEYWAAGAGIDAVLENDAEMLPYMFPNGTSQADIDAYFDSDKMYDTTTVPIALQFPDWKHWLPMIHPKDAFDGFYSVDNGDGTFSAGVADPRHNPFVTYPALRAVLDQYDHAGLIANKDAFYDAMGDFWSSFRNFFTANIGSGASAHWRTTNSVADTYAPLQGAGNEGFGQMTRTSMARLMAVKFFEIHQEYQLEELVQQIVPVEDQPAPRQWIHGNGTYNVFEVPPHFTAEAYTGATSKFNNQPGITGKYETANWYEVQMILNPGNGKPGTVGPVDFNYHPGFIRKSSEAGHPHPLRYYRAMNNGYQVKTYSGDLLDYSDKKRGLYLEQIGLKNILPWNAPGHTEWGFTENLEQTLPGADLPAKIVNAMLTQMAVELEKPQNHPDTYSRSSGGWFSLEYEDRIAYDPSGSGYADDMYRFFTRVRDYGLGLDPARVSRVIDWCELAWPLMPWDNVRPFPVVSGTDATTGSAYSADLDTFITDLNLSTAHSITKEGGPSWLTVATDGSLSGTPSNGAAGPNNFAIKIVDSVGATHYRGVKINVNDTNHDIVHLAQGSSGGQILNSTGSDVDTVSSSTTGADVEWYVAPTNPGSGYYYIQNVASGKRLNAFDTSSVDLAVPGTTRDAAKWELVDFDGTWNFFINKYNGRKLHARSQDSFVPDLQGAQYTGTNMRWRPVVIQAASNNPPEFNANPFSTDDAAENVGYSATIEGRATDLDSDPLSYSKVSGPAWLSIASDGALSGTPGAGDDGVNSFVVQVSDGTDSATAALNIRVLAAPSVGGTLSFSPVEDTYTKQNKSGDNFGTDVALHTKVDGSGKNQYSYIKFNVSGVTGAISEAKLRLYTRNVMNDVTVHEVNDNSWSESAMTWSNQPALGASMQTLTSIATDTWVELDVSSFVAGNGTYTLGLSTTHNAGSARLFDSREGTNMPVLEVTYGGAAQNNAPVFTNDPISVANAIEDEAYSATISGSATDADSDPLTYSKVSGPAWLSVASSGALTGTPAAGDVGANAFSVEVSDGTDVATATLNITVDVAPDTMPPVAPAGLVATAGENAVSLDWDDNGEADFASYTVYRSTTSGSGYVEIVSGLTNSDYNDSGLTNGVGYYYVVTASDAVPNESANSTEASAMPMDMTPPSAPISLSAVEGIAAISLDWADNSESDLATYTVYRSITSGSGYAVIASGLVSSEYDDLSVTNFVDYYYVVTASDATGNESGLSNEAQAQAGSIDYFADSETAVSGTVSGGLGDVQSHDDVYQNLTEVVLGNTAGLEHKWTFDVEETELTTFYVEAYRSAASGSDDFVFSWSSDDVTYHDMVTVSETVDDDQAHYFMLPSGTSGTIHVRVLDKNRDPGDVQLDTLFIDALYIVAEESNAAPAEAVDPTPLDGATEVSVNTHLAWFAGLGAGSHDVYFGTNPTPGAGEFQGNQSGTSYDPGALAYSTTYYWGVNEVNASGTTSGVVWSFTTAAPPNEAPVFTNDPFSATNATEDAAYSATISGSATDANSDPLSYSKVSGPAWLSIASDGTLSGTPAAGDVGANAFVVLVDDGNGGSDNTTLNITVDSAPAVWTELTNDDFEGGIGNWVDGGSDARLTSLNAIGSQCVELRDNTNTSVITLASSLDLSSSSQLRIEFSYVVSSFEGSEDFWVQFSSDGGSSWTTVKSYVNDVDFVDDGTRYNDMVTLDSSSHTFNDNVKVRFRCDASGNGDDVYIDNVVISGLQ